MCTKTCGQKIKTTEKEIENNLDKKKKLHQSSTKMPPGQIGPEFYPKSNVCECTLEHVDSTLRRPRMKCKIP